ncbi:hypothetical protein C4573_01765 [Candidatus Woesearchaeota archaeon]|nr:MAG: hypothetical protein C4573_01765 [Candidatus Woesearchaeota archaeon]
MSLDQRAEKLAEIAINHSTNIQEGDRLFVFGEPEFTDFAVFLGSLAMQKGARVFYDLQSVKEKRALIEVNDKELLAAESERLCTIVEESTAVIKLNATTDPYFLKDVAPEKVADYVRMVRKPVGDRIMGDGKDFQEKKWLVLGYPCEALARDAGMSLADYETFFYGATNRDWKAERARMESLKALFDDAEDVHIVVSGQTDLHLSLRGRGAAIGDGRHNMPDGEIWYAPVEDSAYGTVYFDYPSVRDGNEVQGIILKLGNGEITGYDAKQNFPFLEKMLSLKGAKRLGEFGIGCNRGITQYTKNLLTDEKIGGTVHITPGQAYKTPLSAGGGLNESDIHWDLVLELRKINNNPGGKIWVDGELAQENGVWVYK